MDVLRMVASAQQTPTTAAHGSQGRVDWITSSSRGGGTPARILAQRGMTNTNPSRQPAMGNRQPDRWAQSSRHSAFDIPIIPDIAASHAVAPVADCPLPALPYPALMM
ncbi:MAG: hypothetical protein IT182_13845 [Acidobacteria bacterium]|nr:hypothetical protein [Acidobacteriota bacterium]